MGLGGTPGAAASPRAQRTAGSSLTGTNPGYFVEKQPQGAGKHSPAAEITLGLRTQILPQGLLPEGFAALPRAQGQLSPSESSSARTPRGTGSLLTGTGTAPSGTGTASSWSWALSASSHRTRRGTGSSSTGEGPSLALGGFVVQDVLTAGELNPSTSLFSEMLL